MFKRESIITPAPPTTAQTTITALIESAREQAGILARLAESFNYLDEVSFSDLDMIARNCNNAQRSLETIGQLLAESEVAA